MSYIRPMGDGPITDPRQVDDELPELIVPPTRVPCEQLPADSPWRRPGQVCAGAPVSGGIADMITGLLQGVAAGPVNTTSTAETGTTYDINLLWLAAAGGVAYYLMRKKRKG